MMPSAVESVRCYTKPLREADGCPTAVTDAYALPPAAGDAFCVQTLHQSWRPTKMTRPTGLRPRPRGPLPYGRTPSPGRGEGRFVADGYPGGCHLTPVERKSHDQHADPRASPLPDAQGPQ